MKTKSLEQIRLGDELRMACEKLRRTPMPIADVIPLLCKAADEIDRLAEYEWMYKDLCS